MQMKISILNWYILQLLSRTTLGSDLYVFQEDIFFYSFSVSYFRARFVDLKGNVKQSCKVKSKLDKYSQPAPGRFEWDAPAAPPSQPWSSHTAGSPAPSQLLLAAHMLKGQQRVREKNNYQGEKIRISSKTCFIFREKKKNQTAG